MSIRNTRELKEELNNYLEKNSIKIYDLLMKEFNIFLERTKLGIEMPNYRTLLTGAFCDFYSLSFLSDFSKSTLTDKNFTYINEYLFFAQQKLINHRIKNVVILTANKIEKTDQKFMSFINNINQTYNLNVKVRNTNWYHTDFFKDNILHYDSMQRLQDNLSRLFGKFDRQTFEKNINPKVLNLRLDIAYAWRDYFARIILSSFGRFDIMPTNYVSGQTEVLQKSVLKSIDEESLVIYYNNINVQNEYKTAFLNDVKIFNALLAKDVPIISVGPYQEFSLTKVLNQKNFQNLEDVFKILGSSVRNNLEIVEEPSEITFERTLISKVIVQKKAVSEKPKPKKKKKSVVKNTKKTSLTKTQTLSEPTVEPTKTKTQEEIIIKHFAEPTQQIVSEKTITKTITATQEKIEPDETAKTIFDDVRATNTLNMFWDEVLEEDLQMTEDLGEVENVDLTMKDKKSNVSTKTVQLHAEKNKKVNDTVDFDAELAKNEAELEMEETQTVSKTDNLSAYSETIDFNSPLEEEVRDTVSEDFEITNVVSEAPTNDQSWLIDDNVELSSTQDLTSTTVEKTKTRKIKVIDEVKTKPSKTKTRTRKIKKTVTKTKDFDSTTQDFTATQTVTKTLDLTDFDGDNDKQKLSELLLTVLNNDDIGKIEEYLAKLADYKIVFQDFAVLFYNNSQSLKFSSTNVDGLKIKNLKETISAFDFKELSEYIRMDFGDYKSKIESGYLSKEDFIKYYLIYLKAKLSIDKINYIELVS